MKIIKTILVGAFIWMLGVVVYTCSFFIPILEDSELQANIFLAIFLIPIAWLGARFYFKKTPNTMGLQAGLIMVCTAILLDGIITVPLLIIPNGGTYQSFFSAPAFWLIALEYLLVIVFYARFSMKIN